MIDQFAWYGKRAFTNAELELLWQEPNPTISNRKDPRTDGQKMEDAQIKQDAMMEAGVYPPSGLVTDQSGGVLQPPPGVFNQSQSSGGTLVPPAGVFGR